MDLTFSQFRKLIASSQNDFGKFIGMKLKTLSRVELDQRHLSSDATEEFNRLRTVAKEVAADPAAYYTDWIGEILDRSSDKAKAWQAKRLIDLQMELRRNEEQLFEALKEVAAADFSLRFVHEFETRYKDQLSEQQQNVLKIWRATNMVRLEKFGADLQFKLQAKKRALETELEFLRS